MQYCKIKVDSLVADRKFLMHSQTLFVTISPNPRTQVSMIIKNKNGQSRPHKRAYALLPQKIQYEYCMKVFKEDYIPFFENGDAKLEVIGVPELNECGNVHLHIIINSNNVMDDVELHMLRREVLNGFRTQENLKKGMLNAKDYMNNIVFITKDVKDVMDYLLKDQDSMLKHFDNFYI